jgi:hypothetical protein
MESKALGLGTANVQSTSPKKRRWFSRFAFPFSGRGSKSAARAECGSAIPEAQLNAIGEPKKAGFWRETFGGFSNMRKEALLKKAAELRQGLQRLVSYLKRPTNFIDDISTIGAAASLSNKNTPLRLFVLSLIISEVAARTGSSALGAYLASVDGEAGAILGTTFGGLLPAILSFQIFWLGAFSLLYYANAREKGMLKTAGIGEIAKEVLPRMKDERSILKMIVRNFVLNVPVYLIALSFNSLAAWLLGSASTVVLGNFAGIVEFVVFAALAITVNADVIGEEISAILPKKQLQVSNQTSPQPPQQKEAPPSRSQGRGA